MAQDDELQQAEAEAAMVAGEQLGLDPGHLANRLAGAHTAAMGERMADRYASIGSRMLADAVPSRLDTDLIDRLANVGFNRDTLRRIRVHRGTKAHAAADALGARAFAVGDNDIFFGRGEFDPSSREGRAIIAHEVAHIAPPSPGGMPSSFDSAGGAPVLNERKHGDEDAAGEEAHEERAREAEAMVYAQEDTGIGAGPTLAGGNLPHMDPVESDAATISPAHLEAKVLTIIRKLERGDIERRGRF